MVKEVAIHKFELYKILSMYLYLYSSAQTAFSYSLSTCRACWYFLLIAFIGEIKKTIKIKKNDAIVIVDNWRLANVH